jgi:hypothetical protein
MTAVDPLRATLFQQCVDQGFSGDLLTQCVADGLQNGVDTIFLIFAVSVVLTT